MAAIQYVLPGGAYVNEGTSQMEYLIPGSAYINETSQGAAGAALDEGYEAIPRAQLAEAIVSVW